MDSNRQKKKKVSDQNEKEKERIRIFRIGILSLTDDTKRNKDIPIGRWMITNKISRFEWEKKWWRRRLDEGHGS